MDRDSKSGSWVHWPDLAELRRSRKISVDQIAALTKISTDYLTAIEQGDFEKLPGGVYTTSYIRQYARLIDYPERDLLARFSSTMATSSNTPVEHRDELSPGTSRPHLLRWLSSLVF